jgi:tRNA (cytidine/uridine-2'-O-)-methyltransferase
MHIVLLNPQIPQNTGNIARLCAGTGTNLHLVGELGFSIDEKRVRRAGLDYWPNVKLHTHQTLEDVLEDLPPSAVAFYSTRAVEPYTAFQAPRDAFFVFGAETTGLPQALLDDHPGQTYRIPISDAVRSLNLANACSIVLYDALRRWDFPVSAP